MVVDKSNMLEVLESFPQQCKNALTLSKGITAKGEVTSIVVCGMGGSAIGGDLLKTYMHNIFKPHTFIYFAWRDPWPSIVVGAQQLTKMLEALVNKLKRK